MAKRKSKNSAVFKPPKKTQSRAKQQKNAEETDRQVVDANQKTKSENNNSHNASCLDKLDEHQVEHSTINNIPSTEVPVDPHHSLEEKTSLGDNGEHGNSTNPPEVSHETERTEPDNSDKSKSLNVDLTNVDQPDTKLHDEDSESPSTSNNDYEMLPNHDSECQTGKKLSHEEHLGSSDTVAETSADQIGIQMEDGGSADPVVKRKKRKRMGMCRVGENKRVLKEQGQGNKVGLDVKEETSDSLGSISLEKQTNVELETAANSVPMEDIPVQQEQPDMQHGNEVPVSSELEITNEADPTTNSEAVKTFEKMPKTECMEFGTDERNSREDEPLLNSEMCNDATVEPSTKVTKDFEESTDVLGQELIVREAPVEFLKDTTEAVASTSKDGNYIEQHVECMNDFISDQSKELLDIKAHKIASPHPIVNEIEDQWESLDYSLVAAAVTAENSVNCEENGMWSLSLPPAPPRGEDTDVQTVAELDISPSDADKPLLSPAPEHDPPSPLSIHSLTDSQLNNIPLSLEDLPIYKGSCDLEDATELVCSLIRDLSAMNQLLMDAHRRIGFAQRDRIPPRQPHHSFYGPPYSDMWP